MVTLYEQKSHFHIFIYKIILFWDFLVFLCVRVFKLVDSGKPVNKLLVPSKIYLTFSNQ